MGIYATLWQLKFPRYGDDHTGCEWSRLSLKEFRRRSGDSSGGSRARMRTQQRSSGGRSRELGSGELTEIIHRFHQGPARDLGARYNTPYREMAVAFAITTGVLRRETIPAELL
jgi:hypothetical protein